MFGQDFLDLHMPDPNSHVDIGFNCAVMTMANINNPMGWEVIDSYVSAPSSLHDLNRAVNAHNRIVVWGGASENTIYGCPEHNIAFRAWHDAIHWRHQLPMNLAGEAAVAYIQALQLLRQYGHDDTTEQWVETLLIEVIGMAHHKVMTGEFPADQVWFHCDNGAGSVFYKLAAQVCIELADEDATELDALRLAQEAWGWA